MFDFISSIILSPDFNTFNGVEKGGSSICKKSVLTAVAAPKYVCT
jgi:hypothetical protein